MLIITFSGLDGCGKTTHVTRTANYLTVRGYRVHILGAAHTSVGGLFLAVRKMISRGRKTTEHRAEGSLSQRSTEKQATASHRIGSARWHSTVLLKGWAVYPFDCLLLTVWIHILACLGFTAVVCDRYVYDKIVNLPRVTGTLTRLLLLLSAEPNFAFFLDAAPDIARGRRPEHALDYYPSRYEKYQRLTEVYPLLTAIPSTTVDQTQCRLERLMGVSQRPGLSDSAAPAHRPAPTHRAEDSLAQER